jgi:hypothetical protein
VAAQINKQDVHSYSKVSKWEHVPILVRIPPLKKDTDHKIIELGNAPNLLFWAATTYLHLLFITTHCAVGAKESSAVWPQLELSKATRGRWPKLRSGLFGHICTPPCFVILCKKKHWEQSQYLV